jgi:hypothetical protein
MPTKRYIVTLSPDERGRLDALTKAGKRAARTLTRARGVANLFMLFQPLLGWRYVWPTERRTARDFAEVLR